MSVIEVSHVTKKYRLGQLQSLKKTALNSLNRLLGRPVEKREQFNALDDVSFTVEQGEVLGIIGTNGAGKSTLLKILAGVTKPTQGDVKIRGKVAPLIEVGAGMVGDLTGRENIYLNGSILGLSRMEIRGKLEEIVAFAELEEFIDTPIKRYSSGMAIRLGFAIATSVDADILIVDEVLAVGDLAFQRKCFDRMERLIKQRDRTVLVVGHNIRQLERMCSRMILLERGKILEQGNPTEICNSYYDATDKRLHQRHQSKEINPSISTGEVRVDDILFFNGDDTTPTDAVALHGAMRIRVQFTATCDLDSVEIVLGFHTQDFVYVGSGSSAFLPDLPMFSAGAHRFDCFLPDISLRPGVYSVRLAFLDQFRQMMWYGENLRAFRVTAKEVAVTKMSELGIYDLPFRWEFPRDN